MLGGIGCSVSCPRTLWHRPQSSVWDIELPTYRWLLTNDTTQTTLKSIRKDVSLNSLEGLKASPSCLLGPKQLWSWHESLCGQREGLDSGFLLDAWLSISGCGLHTSQKLCEMPLRTAPCCTQPIYFKVMPFASSLSLIFLLLSIISQIPHSLLPVWAFV